MEQKTVSIIVSGRVQGVGFRYTTQQFAKSNAITGYVRNRNDGCVEIVAQGEETQINTLLKWLKEGGPAYATIAHINFNEINSQYFDIFSIKC